MQFKHCPFCGQTDSVGFAYDYGDVFRSFGVFVTCTNGHRTKAHTSSRSRDDIARAEADALEDWNTRAEPPQAWPL